MTLFGAESLPSVPSGSVGSTTALRGQGHFTHPNRCCGGLRASKATSVPGGPSGPVQRRTQWRPQALPGLLALSCGRPPFLGRAPVALRGGHLGSSSEHPVNGLSSGQAKVRLRADRMHVPPEFSGRLRAVQQFSKGLTRSVFGQVRTVPRRSHGLRAAVLPSAGRAAFGQF